MDIGGRGWWGTSGCQLTSGDTPHIVWSACVMALQLMSHLTVVWDHSHIFTMAERSRYLGDKSKHPSWTVPHHETCVLKNVDIRHETWHDQRITTNHQRYRINEHFFRHGSNIHPLSYFIGQKTKSDFTDWQIYNPWPQLKVCEGVLVAYLWWCTQQEILAKA